MYGCESWTIKIAEWQRIDALELWCWRRLLRVSLGLQEVKSVNPEGKQSWIFFGRTHAEAPILWPPDAKSWLIRKIKKDWRQWEKGTTKDKMIEWHHRLNGHEFEQAPGDGEGQGCLACCSPQGRQESNMTDWLNNKTTIFGLHVILLNVLGA